LLFRQATASSNTNTVKDLGPQEALAISESVASENVGGAFVEVLEER
jgi:hypothetical protein